MNSLHRLEIAIVGLALITAVGTVGYVFVEGMDWLDAAYMTVITMSTVGYGEVQPLSVGGRLFTMALILFAVGFALYFLAVMSSTLVDGRLRALLRGTQMERQIKELRDHVIICGFGRFGRVIVEEMTQHHVSVLVIDLDANKALELERRGIPALIGSAVDDDVLDRAGLDHARAIVAATPSDADNTFITLSARERNPTLRIHARGESDTAIRRLALAGADQVVSAYQIGGQRVAASILRPSVVDFLEIAHPHRGDEVDLEEVRVDARSPLVGRSVASIEAAVSRLRVVALKRGSESIRLIPDAETEIASGDHLVVIGASESLADLAIQASAR
ncbi:MAG: potassium channel protein [Deltaproteobacteria bacterium]|nr:potassium channel protein [Deltaproteobacteria bacterium]